MSLDLSPSPSPSPSDDEASAPAAHPTSAASIAKLLASPRAATRNRGVKLLSQLLPSLSPLPTSSLLAIWKGLFFCFWHADKSLYQSSLATSIASLISSNAPRPGLASRFLDATLLTLRREWGTIDFLRMDKFYLLVRRLLHHTLLFLRSNSWDASLLARVMGILEERALGPEGTKGFSYHVVEVFPEELAKFLPVARGTLQLLLAPFFRILETSADPILVSKVKADVFAKFLTNGNKYLELNKAVGEVEKGSLVDKLGVIGLGMGFSKTLLDLAKKEETLQANKKVLHELREGFFKLEKDLAKSGIEILLPETEILNEVTEVENGEGPGDQLPKKRKKEKEPGKTKGKKGEGKKNTEKKLKTKGSSEEAPVVIASNIELEANTDSGMNEDKENERGSENMITFDENVISNLQKQFEKAAAEAGMSAESKYETETGLENNASFDTTPVKTPKNTRKRKQIKTANKLELSSELELSPEDGNNTSSKGENIGSTAKKVRFSMKNNLVWKPSTPMPPLDLRVPPSATPRGSALKKGVPPGPVRDLSSPALMKRKKPKAKSAKKVVPKGSKSPSMAVKRLRKLQCLSA